MGNGARMTLSVKGDVAACRAALQRLPDRLRSRALVAALNETMTTTSKVAQNAIRQERPVSATGARKQLQIDRANGENLTTKASMRDGPIPLRYYAPRQGSEGVTVNVTGSRKGPVSSDGIKAFVVRAPRDAATGKRKRKLSKHPELVGEVMVRESNKRLHIKKLFGPSVSSVLNKKEVLDLLRSTAAPLFIEKLKQKIKYEAEQLGLKVFL